MKKKRFAMAAVCAVMTIALAGCSMLSSKLNDITGKLVGNSYTITTYDNYRRQDQCAGKCCGNFKL